MTTSTEPRLTTLQRKILTYTATLEGPVTAEDLHARADRSAVEEALLTLITHSLIEYRFDENHFVLTDEGRDRAERIRAYNPQRGIRCKACISVACVCIVRIECLGDGPHSLGCHGSHE